MADGIVDLVRAGVEQVFALEINLCTAEMFGEAFGELERRRAAGKISEEILKLCLEHSVGLGLFVSALEFEERDHGFGVHGQEKRNHSGIDDDFGAERRARARTTGR